MSSRSPVMVIEHAAEATSASDCSVACREIGIRENEQVADALMIAFGVIMGREFSNCYPQGVFLRRESFVPDRIPLWCARSAPRSCSSSVNEAAISPTLFRPATLTETPP